MDSSGSSMRSLAPLLFGFLLLLLTAGMAIFLSSRQQDAAYWVRHNLIVENQLNAVQTLVTDAETGQRGYLLTGRLAYLEPYEISRHDLEGALNTLGSQTTDNPTQQTALARLRPLVTKKLSELQKTVDLRTAGRSDDALALVNDDSGKQLMSDIKAVIADMRGTEADLLDSRSARAALLNRIGQTVLGTSVAVVLLLGLFALADGRRRLLALQSSNERLQREAAERQVAEDQVRQLQKMEAVGKLTGGIAHDFNNMLAIVLGFLDLTRRRLQASNVPGALQCIDSAWEGANRAVLLTKRLLAFSRQQPLEPRPLNANDLIGGMSDLLRRTIGEAIGIETVLAGGLWIASVDAAQLENAVLNLAVNARDAMPDGGKLTIETGNADLDDRYAASHNEVKAGQYVLISVSDTGTGMPPAVVERAFDPFFTTKEVGKGTGLGLSQVFGFVKQSFGHVKIYSEAGAGTSVKIYLPRSRSVVPGKTTTAPVQAVSSGRPDEVVLVVEDEEKVRRMTVESLRELGYTVVHAALPQDALQQLDRRSDITLLFTDIVMPGMNGRQLAERAVSLNPSLKVLYTTGYTRNAIVHHGIVDEGTAFLPKPFTLSQLALKVRQTLDS